MQPIDFPEKNRTFVKPESWTDQDCHPLHVQDVGDRLVSCWKPDEAERARLAAGAPVHLTVWGRGHPPVLLEAREGAPARVELPVGPDMRVEKLDLKPGDVVVVTMPDECHPRQLEEVGAMLAEKLRPSGALALVASDGGRIVALAGLQPEQRSTLFAAVDAWRARHEPERT
jgi:hypothetical protein